MTTGTARVLALGMSTPQEVHRPSASDYDQYNIHRRTHKNAPTQRYVIHDAK